MPYPSVCRWILSFLLITTFIQVATHPAQAQSPDAILKRATKALGGEKNIRIIKSRSAKGSLTRITDAAQGTYQTSTMRPGLYNTSLEIRGFETTSGFNGKSGWSRDSRDGLRTLTGFASRDFQGEAAYRNSLWLDYKREKSKLAAGPAENVDGKDTRTVIITTARNAQIKISFDATSFLPLREEFGVGEHARIYEYANYRVVDGVQEPYSVKLTAGKERYQINLDEILHNPQIAR